MDLGRQLVVITITLSSYCVICLNHDKYIIVSPTNGPKRRQLNANYVTVIPISLSPHKNTGKNVSQSVARKWCWEGKSISISMGYPIL